MNKNYILFSVFLFIYPMVSLADADSIDEKIIQVCGVHPAIAYIKQLKEEVIDKDMLIATKKCAEGRATINIFNWLDSDSEMQGCLEKENKYQPEYIQKLSLLIGDANKNSAGSIDGYQECVNEVRAEGRGIAMEEEDEILPVVQDSISLASQARKIDWKHNTRLNGYEFSEIDKRVQSVLQECNQCLHYSSTVTDYENAAKPNDTLSLESKNCPGEMLIFAVKESCNQNSNSAGIIQEGDGSLFADFVIKPNEKIVMEVGGSCMFGVSPIACYKE